MPSTEHDDAVVRLRAAQTSARQRNRWRLVAFGLHLGLFVGCIAALQGWLAANEQFQAALQAGAADLLVLVRLPFFGWALGVMLHGIVTMLDLRPARRLAEESLLLRERLAEANAELRRTDAQADDLT